MNIYKVHFNKNEALSAEPANHLEHGDIGLLDNDSNVSWFAVESPDEQTAIEIATKVVTLLWRER